MEKERAHKKAEDCTKLAMLQRQLAALQKGEKAAHARK